MVKFTLYHANWCGHCRNFIHTWNQLRNDSSLNDVEFEEFEQTKSPEVMKKNNIRGYPTLVIDKENHEGRRDYDTLRNKLQKLLKKGGSNNLKENNNENVDIVKEKLEETDNENAELMFGGSKRKKSKKRKVNRKPVISKNKKRKKTKELKKRKAKRRPKKNKKVKKKRKSKKIK